MKFVPELRQKKLRGKLGDESGETDLQQVSLSLNGEEDSKKQHTVTENGTRLVVVWTDGSAFHKDMPLVAAAGAGIAFFSKIKSKRELRLERTGRDHKPERRVGGTRSGRLGARLQT